MTSKDIAARVLDVTARSIDLLTVLAKLADGSGTTPELLKQVSKWLGKEGLDEHELQFFLENTHALAQPNESETVARFFDAVTDPRPKTAVVPLAAVSSGSLGKLISKDHQQRWITSTVCCLFRYHDERLIKQFLTYFIMLNSHQRAKPFSENELIWHPDTLRLGEVVKKVVDSNWLHVANAGMIGSPNECPRLPEELRWACEKGHNVEMFALAQVINRLRDFRGELVIQSKHLLTNLVLWLIWHFDGLLRVVAGGKKIYEVQLGLQRTTLECRVSQVCVEGASCPGSKGAEAFTILEPAAEGLKSIFGGNYDSQTILMSEPRVRQKLYHSPFQYPRGAAHSLRIQTQRTAQELIRWFVNLPVSKVARSSQLEFWVHLKTNDQTSLQLRIADLLGTSPALLNMQCGELGRAFVVFSRPYRPPPLTVDDFMDRSDTEGATTEDDIVDSKERPLKILRYFPILQDLMDVVRVSCKCYNCFGQLSKYQFVWDEGCLRFKAFMEVMFFFSHSIADAMGVCDASSCPESSADDPGAMNIFMDILDGMRLDADEEKGKLRWTTLLSTTAQLFLGCPPLDKLTDAMSDPASAAIVAVQNGDLAIVAPWLDTSQPLQTRGCFQISISEGRLGIPVEIASEKIQIQAVSSDLAVIETQQTENFDDCPQSSKSLVPTGCEIDISEDRHPVQCTYFLVSFDVNRYKLLMRIASNDHSRMIDPARSILKLSQEIPRIKCSHAPARKGTLPSGFTAELWTFDELLGRWKDTEFDTVSAEENVSLSPSAIAPGRFANCRVEFAPQLTSLPEDSTGSGPEIQERPPTRMLHVSHVLDSSFKYNIALALAGEDPTFLNRGDACISCALQCVAEYKLEGDSEKRTRRLINGTKNLERLVPRAALGAPQRLRLTRLGGKAPESSTATSTWEVM
jgi:hypothetical protein